jgi:hypothetical protein
VRGLSSYSASSMVKLWLRKGSQLEITSICWLEKVSSFLLLDWTSQLETTNYHMYRLYTVSQCVKFAS